MTPTGTLDDDGTLVLTRSFAAGIDDVWASITEPERLARWIGTWTGDPADGHVQLTMTGEGEDVPPVRYDIVACEPPRLLSVDALDDDGRWQLVAELSATDGRTTLVLRQMAIDLDMVGDVGPGWEWYLDRLVAAVDGGDLPSGARFTDDYMRMKPAYRSMAAAAGAPTGDPAAVSPEVGGRGR